MGVKNSQVKCPKCQSDNLRSRKFCRECGGKLISVCVSCGLENHLGDKFCGECGHSLVSPGEANSKRGPSGELSWDEKLARMQKYLPRGLTEKILDQRDKIEGERKQVTVLFCDMAGFTPLTEKLGQEEIYSLMDEVFEILIHQVHSFEGTVNKMTGDGIMALFGAPIALEDAPQRAIRSGLAIQEEMSRLSRRLEQKAGIPPLRMRIGIHTGPVVVGTLGNDLRVEFNAVGDTVTLASRMEGLAEPGTIFVSEDTYRLAEGLFSFDCQGEKKIKGKEKPVRTYRVLAPKTRRTRFEVSAEKGLTSFVGRERELELLVDGLERAKEGRGQVFSIVAEAGVGKSRLLHEFSQRIDRGSCSLLEGRCLSYGRGMAYHPIIGILKSSLGIQEGDDDGEVRKKVGEWARGLRGEADCYLPYLMELLSVTESGIERVLISPDARKNRILEAFKWLMLRMAAERPLGVLLEDLHWMDRSSEETLRPFLEVVQGARILAVLTYRPEFVPAWAARSYHSQITLNRLSNRETLEMVNRILRTRNLSRDLEELILQKTEGVPLFIEEFLRSFRDLKIMVQKGDQYQLAKGPEAVEVPSTLQDVIMARVDSLPEGARDLLQTASVIDREFRHELIKRAAGHPEAELLSRLSALKNSELLYERDIYPHSAYVFKHALTREVVYDSLLSKRKKQLHERIGKAMEELYRKNLAEHSDVLAEHFIKSENFEKGAEFARMAGKKARLRSGYHDAISYTYKELFCLEKLPDCPAVQKRIMDARVTLANYCMNLNDHAEAYEAVSPVADLALRLNYRKVLPSISTAIGSYLLFVEEDYPQGIEYLKQALEFSEEVKDYLCLWNACNILGTTLSWSCEFQKAQEYFRRSLDLSMAAGNPAGIASARINTGVSYLFQGKIDVAHQISQETLKTADGSGDIFVQGMAYSYCGTASYYKGFFAEAEDHFLKGIALGDKTTHFTWGSWASAFLGDMYFDLGEYEKALHSYRRAFAFLEKTRFGPSWLHLMKVAIARARVVKGEQEINLSELMKCYDQNKNRAFTGWMAQYISEILLHLDRNLITDAQEWAEKAIEADRNSGMRFLLARDYALAARILEKRGERERSREAYGQAIKIFQECGARGYWRKTGREIAAVA